MKKFECPKPKTGILCGDCQLQNSCPFLNPPKPSPRLYPRPTRKVVFQPLPIEISKPIYRMALLISEDFQLTKVEFRDLIYYTSRFGSVAPKGGRGKSWERVFALVCVKILERDNRPIYSNNRLYFDTRYQLKKADTKELANFVKEEFQKVSKTIPALR